MAAVEKLFKAVEALKNYQNQGTATTEDTASLKKKDQPLGKKEKITYCNTIADSVCSTLRTTPDFQKFLGIALDTFLCCCDDPDADVRMTADECLNRTIKTLLDNNLSRIQVELYKEIKKNGPSRSLRAALWRFADLCHLIKPQKCRPYITNLLSCLVQIARRTEESVQETLSSATCKICEVLGKFATDGEIKVLLRAFLPNLRSSSAVARRTAATCLTAICQHSRKPHHFFVWLLISLIDAVVPVNQDYGVPVVLGVLLCFRHIIPYLVSRPSPDIIIQGSFGSRNKDQEYRLSEDHLIQVYELLLHYVQHSDHNVVTASLESLQQLLRTPPPLLVSVLLSNKGIHRTYIYASDKDVFPLTRTGSELGSVPSLVDDSTLDDETDCAYMESQNVPSQNESVAYGTEPEQIGPIHPPIRDDLIDSMSCASIEDIDYRTSAYSNIKIGHCVEEKVAVIGNTGTLGRTVCIKETLQKQLIEKQATEFDYAKRTPTPSTVPYNVTFRTGDLGAFSDSDIPLIYCTRLLCSSFLLTGTKRGLMPEQNARVSVKSLAIGCLSGVLSLYPEAFCLPLFKNSCTSDSQNGEIQSITDVLLFAQHSDPQLRGSTAVLVGHLISAAMCKSKWDIGSWLPLSEITINTLVGLLLALLEDEASVTCRLALVGLKSCLSLILNSIYGSLGLQMLSALLTLPQNSYWLVKVELLELLPEISYTSVSYLETITAPLDQRQLQSHSSSFQSIVLEKVLLYLLSDEDYRVRQAAAHSFVKIVPQLFYPQDHPNQDPIISLAHEKTATYLEPILHDTSVPPHPAVHGLVFPYSVCDSQSISPTIASSLSRIINMLVTSVSGSTSKHLTLGCLNTLCLLSEEYPVTLYSSSWICAGHSGNANKKATLLRSNSVPRSSPTSKTLEISESERGGLLPLVVSLLTSTSFSMDLAAHQHCLQLASNLFAGATLNCLQQPVTLATNETGTVDSEPWAFLKDCHISTIANKLFVHLMRLLSICTHVMEDQNPVPPQVKSALPSLPNAPSLSPIKRKSKPVADISNSSTSSSSVGRSSPAKAEKEEKGSNKPSQVNSSSTVGTNFGQSVNTPGGASGVGTFYHLPHYMKLYEVLRGAYSNYRVSLDLQNSEKFNQLLHTALYSLAQILEVATLAEMGHHAEELLRYLRIAVNMEPTITILCCQQNFLLERYHNYMNEFAPEQIIMRSLRLSVLRDELAESWLWACLTLLKALFGTNLTSQSEGVIQEEESCKPGRAARLITSSPGLYHYCFLAPFAQLVQTLNSVGPRSSQPIGESNENSNWLGWIKKKWERKLPTIGKSSGKSDKSNLASYIRLFESLVIRALKLYTVTSSVDLQCQVLQLLAQLVQLRVNYCLLDSDQIFIGFIIKQFEYIEGGQVQNTDRLIPHIFHFLVLLSYERYHSKSIISVPKIIQLCDGIMASGQPPVTHTIPSLLPIVEDLFLVRGTIHKSDAGKELDIQREVLVSMLFRFIHYYQVLEIFILILQQNYKECEERWKKLSRQIVDTLLPFLAKQQVNLDNRIALDVLHRLFEAVAPFVFRPVDVLLHTILAAPYNLSTLLGLQRWMSLVLSVIRVLIAQSKEEVVLGRLAELSLSINIFNDTVILHRRKANDPSFSIHSIPNDAASSPNGSLTPEEILARFLLQVIGMTSSELRDLSFTPTTANDTAHFLCEQIAHMLLYVTHMFQSGLFRRVTNVCMGIIKLEPDADSRFYSITHINRMFLDLAVIHPTLTLQWCNILILLNFDSQPFWSQILRKPLCRQTSFSARPIAVGSNVGEPSLCSNMELVHKGGLILFCDYICENLSDAEHMTWLIVNHINELVELYSEPPINDLISNVHRNPAASGLFIQAINTRCENLNRPSVVRKMLGCLEAIHNSQSGPLLILLVERFLPTPHLAIARASASMACRRVEMLLAEAIEESNQQLMLDDLDKLLESIQSHGIAKKHSRLVMLLYKLREHWFPTAQPSLIECSEQACPRVNASLQTIDKAMFLKLAQQCCQDSGNRHHCVQLLAALEYNDLLALMAAKEFNLLLLEDSLQHGVNMFLNQANEGTQSEQESPLSPLPHTTGGLALYSAAKQTLLQQVTHLVTLVPIPSQVYNPNAASLSVREAKYALCLSDLFSDGPVWDTLQQVTPVVGQFLQLQQKHVIFSGIPFDVMTDLSRFAVLILEAIHWLMHKKEAISPIFLQAALDTVRLTLHDCNLVGILGQKENLNWACTAIYSIHCIFERVHNTVKNDFNFNPNWPWVSIDSEVQHVTRVCTKMASMVSWMEQQKCIPSSGLPVFLSDSLNSIIVSLARLPIVNSCVRTPPLAWQLGWTPEGVKNIMISQIPPLPVDLLQERDVLWQYIFRVNLLGWTSRQQFEETWMALLGVLSAIPSGDTAVSEDEIEHVHTACLAVKCITSLLLQTLLLPQPGNPCNSRYLWQPFEKPVAYLHTRHGKKFPRVWNLVEQRRQNLTSADGSRTNKQEDASYLPCVTSNKQLRTRNCNANQVSLEYLQVVVGKHDDAVNQGPSSFDEREKSLSSSGLDLHSCLHFLLDLYSQWLSPTTTSSIQLSLLTEAVRSVVMLSDIFTEKAQFEWMLDTLLELHRSHPPEDEIMAQYLAVGICKAAAVLGLSKDTDLVESVKKVVEQSFKSTYLSTRIMVLHGMIYLLQLGPNDLTRSILTTVCDYLLQHLQNSQLPSSHSEDHTLAMWTVVFYLIENLKEHPLDGEFSKTILQLALDNLLPSDNASSLVQLSVTFGLERLVLTNVVRGKNMEPIIKSAVSRFCQPNPGISLASLGLLLSCIYAGKDTETWNLDDLLVSESSPLSEPEDNESLIAAMEKVTILFNRLKRGYPCEAETIAAILPYLLTDHFPLSEIMNKIIVEFISSQQPHPHLLAVVVFWVFEWAHQQGKYPLVREWVLLSLSNFTQQAPIAMAVWSLTCFFISASVNHWLRAVFPYVQQRMGKLGSQDVQLFCMAGKEFYNQLLDENEREVFYSTISAVASTGTPYADLLDQL